nr:testis-specific serine/threonine-protein kinase 3-like [Dermacentor andersoni]
MAAKSPSPPAVRATTSKQFLALAGYILGREIGQGTYSKVRIGVKGDQRYAVKIIPRHLAPREYVFHFLPRELAIIPKLKHPNIIRVFDVLEIKRKVFVVMELATQGDLLLKITNDGRFSESKAFHYFEQICDAVAYLHRQNIVHRDLKCENILLSPKRQVKLADFSFARHTHNANKRKVLSRTFCGSAAYAAPEVIQNIPYRPKRYDSWSLGVILYIMVCGQLPFDDTNPFQQVRAQMSRQISFPASYGLTKMCRNLIRHLLEPYVLYRCSVPRAMKHPWMRKERIKRKLKHMKDSKLSELGRKGSDVSSAGLRAAQSDVSMAQLAAGSPGQFRARAMSASSMPRYREREDFDDSPGYYSKTTLACNTDEGPIGWGQPGMQYMPNPIFQQPMRQGHAVVNTRVVPPPMGGGYDAMGMYGNMGGGMMAGTGYMSPMAGAGMFPMQGAPMMGMPPRRRRSGGNLNINVATPRCTISVSSSSSGSYV